MYVMTEREIIDRLKKEFPDDLIWRDTEEWGSMFLGGISFSFDCLDLPYFVTEEYLPKAFSAAGKMTPDLEGTKVRYISDAEFDIIISALKMWKADIDAARHGDDVPQIVLIHPDMDEYSCKELLRDFDCITTVTDQWGVRAGIMNAKKWNFSNPDLVRLLTESSGDCFNIGPLQDLNDANTNMLLNELQKIYRRNVKSITKIFSTDYD